MITSQLANSAEVSWMLDYDYYGRILYGPYSRPLKKRLLDCIASFVAFEKIGNPAIPYIAAWRKGDKTIWYEYTSRRFSDLLQCSPGNVCQAFSSSIIGRCIYTSPGIESAPPGEILNRFQLNGIRKELRRQGTENGVIEAVYKIALRNDTIAWLKDQASIETHTEDGICLSPGILVNVTKEMQAEENLKRMKEALRSHRDHLEDIVKDRTRKLRKAQLEVVYRLARAAEYRDNDTGQHVTKISRYCAILGQAAGLRKSANTLLFHAAPMHDVGKIGISDRILLKPSKLTRQEFELMKTHCEIGAELLSGHTSDLLRVAKKIALTHHEKWDGSGYPNGLDKEGIPLAGRITAVCDVFDALTSQRPYKDPWSVDDAVAELKRGKGAHFDPHLVDLFIQKLPQIRKAHAN